MLFRSALFSPKYTSLRLGSEMPISVGRLTKRRFDTSEMDSVVEMLKGVGGMEPVSLLLLNFKLLKLERNPISLLAYYLPKWLTSKNRGS